MQVYRQSIPTPCLGTLFTPQASGIASCVIVLPGSDGGIPELIAQRIAQHGYHVLALGYFGMEKLPQYLENIPLEYFQKAMEYLASQIKNDPIIVMGYSRGGELALLLGAHFPQLIQGVIAVVPNSMMCGGFPHINLPAWTLNGRPLAPFLEGLMSHEITWSEADDLKLACEKGVISHHSNTAQDPCEVVDLFLARHEHQGDLRSAAIPVERIACPLLLLSGEEDRIWPSALYAHQIMDRLAQAGSKIERKSVVYPHAGHGILAPYEGAVYHEVGKFWCTLGGTPEGNKLASEKAWQEIFQFLERE